MARCTPFFVLASALALSCHRKAPGPDECRAFALKMFRLGSEEELRGRTRKELALRDQLDALTRECLVLPYDRQLLRCVEETGGAPMCRAEFNRRRGGGSENELTR